MTGKVTQVDEAAKTFTAWPKPCRHLSATKLKVLPKVGDIIEITYTENPGGPMEATSWRGFHGSA